MTLEFLTILAIFYLTKCYQRLQNGSKAAGTELQEALQLEIMVLWLSNPGGIKFRLTSKESFSGLRMSIGHFKKFL